METALRKLIVLTAICAGTSGCASDVATESAGARSTSRNSIAKVEKQAPVVVQQVAAEQDHQKNDLSTWGPLEVFEDYTGLLRQGRGHDAIRKHWNIRRAAERIYGVDFNTLSDEEQAEVVVEHERTVTGIYTTPAIAKLMKQVEYNNVTCSRQAITCVIRFDLSLKSDPEGKSKPTGKSGKFLLARDDVRWRIIDISSSADRKFLSEELHLVYKNSGESPLTYANGLNKGLPTILKAAEQSLKPRVGSNQP